MYINQAELLETRDILRSMANLADLHRHFDGSVRPGTLWEMSEKYYQAMPDLSYEQFTDYITCKSGDNLLAYLDKFNLPLQYTQFYDTIRRCAYEICEDAYLDGLHYLEIRINPIIHRRAGLSTRQVIDAVRAGIADVEANYNDFTANIIIIAIRNHGGNIAKILVKEIAGCSAFIGIKNGVVGFDIAGAESGYPPILFKEAYDLARSMGLGLTAHAGEGAGPRYIWQAIDDLQVDRVGHGVAAVRDWSLMKELATRAIPLETCITSNMDTGSTSEWLGHPVINFIEMGIPIIICTDNPTVSATSLVREYAVLRKLMTLSENDLRDIVANSGIYQFRHFRTRGSRS